MELDEEELKATQKYHEKRINYIHVPVREEKGEEVMHVAEGWEYNRLLKIYKKELIHIRNDETLDDEEREKQRAIVNEQISQLQLSYQKKLKKPKYNRAKAEEETAKLIKKFEEEER